MKLKNYLKENKLKAVFGTITVIFGAFIALFTALDKGIDFYEEHIKVEASRVPDSIVIAPRVRMIADAEYKRSVYDPGLKIQQAKTK